MRSNIMNPMIIHYNFFKKLCALHFVNAIYRFGSRAQGTYKYVSDIELAIDCKGETKQQWYMILDIIEQNNDTLLHIDCIRLDTLSDAILLNTINAHKMLLYQRG